MTRIIDWWEHTPVQTKVVVSLLALFITGLIGLSAYIERQTDTAAILSTHASAARAMSERYEALAAQRDREVTQKEAVIQALQAQVEVLKKRYRAATVPDAVPAPDDPALHVGLLDAGMKSPPLDRGDAIKVWDWHQAALRIPAYESRLSACDDLTKGQEVQINVQRDAINALKISADNWMLAADSNKQRAEALQSETKALSSAIKAQRAQKWMLVGGALVGGYLAGRSARR